MDYTCNSLPYHVAYRVQFSPIGWLHFKGRKGSFGRFLWCAGERMDGWMRGWMNEGMDDFYDLLSASHVSDTKSVDADIRKR
jgi:hypothetical protein